MTTRAGDPTLERITHRPYAGDADYWRIRELLIATYPLTPVNWNWEIRRWDGQRWHTDDLGHTRTWPAEVHLWETEGGQLVGAVHPDGRGEAQLELHPDYRHLEEEMLAWAEEHLAIPNTEGPGRVLETFAFEYDIPRRALLERRGWQRLESRAVDRRVRFGRRPIPALVVAPGYVLRGTRPGDAGEAERLAAILNAGFNRTCHNAVELANFMACSPSFRHDLQLVAEAPDGTFAALVGVTYDEANRRGIFEPVCTHPEHRRKGLARALILEGMRRLVALGATDAYVGTGSAVAANALYDAAGFTEMYVGYYWRKAL